VVGSISILSGYCPKITVLFMARNLRHSLYQHFQKSSGVYPDTCVLSNRDISSVVRRPQRETDPLPFTAKDAMYGALFPLGQFYLSHHQLQGKCNVSSYRSYMFKPTILDEAQILLDFSLKTGSRYTWSYII
jgi:hypothetical protein